MDFELPNITSINTIPLMTHERRQPIPMQSLEQPPTSTANLITQAVPNQQVQPNPPITRPPNTGNHTLNSSTATTMDVSVPNAWSSSQAEIQAHQAAGTLLSNLRRTFGKQVFTGEKDGRGMTIDSLLYELEMFKAAHRCTDDALLHAISFIFTGEADLWWKNARKRIANLSHLKVELFSRFDLRGSSVAGIRAQIAARKQKEGESMIVFYENLSVMMNRLPNEYQLRERVETLKSNGNGRTNDLLVGRTFRTEAELVRTLHELSIPAENRRKERKMFCTEQTEDTQSDSDDR